LRRDRIHPIGRWADKNLVFPRYTETAEQRIDSFIAPNAHKEVFGCDVLRCVVVGIPEVAEELFEFVLVRIRVAV